MGAVVGSSGQPVSIASARVAVAASPGRTVRWAQIRVTSDKSAFAWLVPVLPGARIDLASDAWLDALDAATVPVVKSPKSTTECTVPSAPQLLSAVTSPASRGPLQALVALDEPSLASFVSGSGFSIPDSLATALGEVFSSGSAVLALVYAAGPLPVHTLRVVDDGPATLPFSLSGSIAGDAAVTAFAIASGARQAGSSPLTVDPSAVVWLADGTSSYETVIDSLITGASGNEWLTQSSEPTAFFDQTPIESGLTLPAALDDYFLLASAYGDTSADPAACSAAASGTPGSSSSYAAACPSGALAIVPGASPCVLSAPDATSIGDLVCGAAVDAALAVGNLFPADVWLTRIEGIVTVTSAADVPLEVSGTTFEPVVLTAGSYGPGCGAGASGAPEGGAWSSEGGQGEGGFGGAEGGGSGDPLSGSSSGGEGGLASSLDDVASATSDGCDSSSSSSTEGDSSGGCGGDPSSSDSSSGGCGGDSSSTDSGGGSCDGGSGGGDSGGCSGEGGGSNDCSTAKHGRRARSPLSRTILVAAAVLGLARRLRRPELSRTK